MSALKGTKEGKQLMAQVAAHKGGGTSVGSKPGEAANTAGTNYADPGYQSDKLKRYPVDTAEHTRAALSYIGKKSNAAKYSSGDLAKVKANIYRAAKAFGIDSYESVAKSASNK